MSKIKNAVWGFFASVKLALIVLIILATTSIIGTLIKQGQTPAYYVQEYGLNLARIFERLDITNMYSSWWFVALLCLFAINLVICSIERLPGVWRTVVLDNLAVDPVKLEKMSFTHQTGTSLSVNATVERLHLHMVQTGWNKPRQLDRGDSLLLFSQKGAWTRLGVYVVHLSILIILVGAITGSFFGFQAYVFLPEGRATSNIFLRKDKEPYPLGFKLQCDRFEKSFYPNGMIKQYRADLSILDPEREGLYKKSIIVNDPLTYQGLNFYVGDSFPLDEYFVEIRNLTNGREQAFRIPSERDVAWQGTKTSFRIEELKRDEDGAVIQARISFTAESLAEPSVFWINDKGNVTIGSSGEDYTLSFRQLYSTLLLITKDPGILIVYSGFILMVIGLAISFFLSHRRIWVQITPHEKQKTQILVSGTSNKHRLAFERHFDNLTTAIQQDTSLTVRKKSKEKLKPASA